MNAMKLRQLACTVALATLWPTVARGQYPSQAPGTMPGVSTVVLEPTRGTAFATNPQLAHQPMLRGAIPGNVDRGGFSVDNLPAQPQVAKGRCQVCTLGVDCADNCGGHQTFRDLHPYDFQPLAHGEHLGPVRLPSTIDYRIRIGDRLRFTYILSREVLSDSFPLRVGDELQITSVSDPSIKLGDVTQGKGVAIQPDGMLYLPLIGKVRAHGLTISQLRQNLENAYLEQIRNPAIDIYPIKTNTLLEDIRAAVDARAGQGGQVFFDTVQPDGTIRLPKLGSICVQGMTFDEVKREVNLQYREIVSGLEVETHMDTQAQHFIFVYGEVNRPDRYELLGPTSVTQALALAQGMRIGGNAREIVIFRRAEDWRLIATRVDLRGAHLGKVPLPTDEIWLRDSDLIIVPPTPITRFDNFVQQVFTDGIYGVFPLAQLGSGFTIRNGIFAN
jgi:polysaccharide biosynthesis/export protein